jgi:aspartate carbamoyltransferase catalytic subunit
MKQPRHLLDLESLSRDEILAFLEAAESLSEILDRPIPRVPALRGRTVLHLFFEPSTRTRHSFELACKVLGADALSMAAASSSAAKGESLVDTARTAEAMGVDAIVVRHSSSGVPHLLARRIGATVISAGDGAHEHPTQGLLDLFTVRRRKGRVEGLKVALVGDVEHSRVARSAIWGFTRLGAEVVCCGPATLLPVGLEALGARTTTDLDEALRDADVVMALRIQEERQSGGRYPSLAEYRLRWGLDPRRLGRARPDAILMHPGPVNRGVELTPEVMSLDRSVIEEQVRSGVAVRMAVLYLLLGGGAAA